MARNSDNAAKIKLSWGKEESRLMSCLLYKGLRVHYRQLLCVCLFSTVHAKFWKLLLTQSHWHSSWSLGNDGQAHECGVERAGTWVLSQCWQRCEHRRQVGRVGWCLPDKDDPRGSNRQWQCCHSRSSFPEVFKAGQAGPQRSESTGARAFSVKGFQEKQPGFHCWYNHFLAQVINC